ncbi:uncharacterized protein LOC110987206 [Acanthaster planci]|uniref:alpha-amylase n=1 Tax=Acanthaster planci TaxID=133434 RepID=A0A8B7ZIP6_ACAPL|nr:uncharacterized protein LOC110987206 [Acanthaster planci]
MARLFLLLAALCTTTWAQYWNPHMEKGRHVMVNLMSWKWKDVAEECERYLGPNGFGGVQVSPPNEHAVLPNQPWWQRYLPVSYELQSRSGTEEELRDMVKRCNEAGVRIYANAVINHMANGEMAEGSAGNPYDPETLSFPKAPYTAQDFSVYNQKCPRKSGNIDDYKNEEEIRNCNLAGLPDLDTSIYHVRYTIAEYMNKLIDIGIAGFHVSNAENIWPNDLAAIYKKLRDLNEIFFEAGSRPFLFQEVDTTAANANIIKPIEYLEMGSVTEFEYGKIVSLALRGTENNLASLGSIEDKFSLVSSSGAVAFVDNADTQRSIPSIITYKEPRLYLLANAFMLAYPYGLARVMSSYDFTSFDEGPPSDLHGAILSPIINEDGSCGNGWVCEHRWTAVKNMIGFRNTSNGEPLVNWWSNNKQQVAFGRGDKAFIVLNNEDKSFSEFLYTGLPVGEYCDIIDGDFDLASRVCTGRVITVDELGFASFTQNNDGPPVAAIHINAKVSDEGTVNEPSKTPSAKTEGLIIAPPIPPSFPPSQNHTLDSASPESQNSATASTPQPTFKRTTVFIQKQTDFGQNLFIRGGLGEGCTGACAIPITHITTGNNAQYNAWKTGDNFLDWYGVEDGQNTYNNVSAEGTPLIWTTNNSSNTANVATDGYGYTPLNQWGANYWMVDLEMDCSKTNGGWFELKAFVMNGVEWESDVSQNEACQGSPGGNKPSNSINHFARCGYINVFKFGENKCTIDEYGLQPTQTIPEEPSLSQSPENSATEATSVPTASTPQPTFKRTTIFIQKQTDFGQNLFIRGGLGEGCTGACAIPITHITTGNNAQYNAWKTGDNFLDWYGVEDGQNTYNNVSAEGTPLIWTTNNSSNTANVATDGYGYTPLNQWGANYWMVDLEMDCSKTNGGWFELKAFVMNGVEWESDVSQNEACQGSPGGNKPSNSINHFARCGYINVFKFGRNECTIKGYSQGPSKAPPALETITPSPSQPLSTTSPTQSPSSDKSKDSKSENEAGSTAEPRVSGKTKFFTDVPKAPNTESTQKRTIIFLKKVTYTGQHVFIRGGIDHDHRSGCTTNVSTSACAIPIKHITPGENFRYDAWKTGDNYLDWYGAEKSQNSYQGTASQGTPLVWTTNNPSDTATLATNGYGYTSLNQWGDHYWMVELKVDCAKTEDGWFELKAFVLNGEGWESDISQSESCNGSAGGNKPFTSINHFARCGFINVFKFGEDECTIDTL